MGMGMLMARTHRNCIMLNWLDQKRTYSNANIPPVHPQRRLKSLDFEWSRVTTASLLFRLPPVHQDI